MFCLKEVQLTLNILTPLCWAFTELAKHFFYAVLLFKRSKYLATSSSGVLYALAMRANADHKPQGNVFQSFMSGLF